jgi:hypothetical protein
MPHEDSRKRRSASAHEARARIPFFLAIFQSGLRGSRIFRVYSSPDALLFIDVGPLVVFIDVETARQVDPTHWAVKAASALKTGLVASVGGILLVAVILLRLLLPVARDDPSHAADLVAGGAVIVVLAVAFVIFAVTATVHRLTRRVAHLDALSEEALSREARGDKWNFRAAAGDLSEVSIDPLGGTGVLGAKAGKAAARLSFRHERTGKWKLNLVTAKDTRAAVRTFRRLLGVGKVRVNVRGELD